MSLGVLRFALALLVVLGHANLRTYHIGESSFEMATALVAVQIFFMISGFYMAASYRRNYRGAWAAFLASRFLRLWPAYLLSLLLTYLLFEILHATYAQYPTDTQNQGSAFQYFVSGGAQPLWFHLSSILMLGQDIISLDGSLNLVLPDRVGWSLGAELMMYAMVPFIWRWRLPVLILAAALSFVVKFGLLHLFGFRQAYFPFYANLGYFLLGYAMFGVNTRICANWPWRRVAPLLGAVVLAMMWVIGDANFEANLIKHLYVVAAVVALLAVVNIDERSPLLKLIGEASYGVYLTHLSFLWFAIDYFGDTPAHKWGAIGATVACSLLIELLLQRPLDKVRRRLLWRPAGHDATRAPRAFAAAAT